MKHTGWHVNLDVISRNFYMLYAFSATPQSWSSPGKVWVRWVRWVRCRAGRLTATAPASATCTCSSLPFPFLLFLRSQAAPFFSRTLCESLSSHPGRIPLFPGCRSYTPPRLFMASNTTTSELASIQNAGFGSFVFFCKDVPSLVVAPDGICRMPEAHFDAYSVPWCNLFYRQVCRQFSIRPSSNDIQAIEHKLYPRRPRHRSRWCHSGLRHPTSGQWQTW